MSTRGLNWIMIGIFAHRHLILYRSYADLKAEAERTYLGILWWVLEPVINMAVYYFVFSTLLRRGEPDFAPFLLIGLVAWRWFESTVRRGCQIILASKGLILQTSLPKAIFPITGLLVNTFKFLIAFACLLIFLWFYGFHPGLNDWAQLPVVMLVQFLLLAAVAMPLSAVVPFVPDLFEFVLYGMRLLFFMSGIFYDIGRIAPDYAFLEYLNPMAFIISCYRDVLMHGEPLRYDYLAVWSILSIGATLFGLLLFRRLDPVYAKRMVK